jgi:hypothetical protein
MSRVHIYDDNELSKQFDNKSKNKSEKALKKLSNFFKKNTIKKNKIYISDKPVIYNTLPQNNTDTLDINEVKKIIDKINLDNLELIPAHTERIRKIGLFRVPLEMCQPVPCLHLLAAEELDHFRL